MGVGNEQRGDDVAGVLVARALSHSQISEDVVVIEAGLAPENATAALRRFAPDLVLLVDAAEMGEAPGTVRWVEAAEIEGMSASTHTLPLSMLADYLRLELGCEVVLLGIQPASMEYGVPVSDEVSRAVEQIVSLFKAR